MLVILKKIDEYYYKPFHGRVNPNLEWLLSKVNKIVKIEKYDKGIGYRVFKEEGIWARFAIHKRKFSEYFDELDFDKYFKETDF